MRCRATYNSKYLSGETMYAAMQTYLNADRPSHFLTIAMQAPEDLTTSLSFLYDIFRNLNEFRMSKISFAYQTGQRINQNDVADICHMRQIALVDCPIRQHDKINHPTIIPAGM